MIVLPSSQAAICKNRTTPTLGGEIALEGEGGSIELGGWVVGGACGWLVDGAGDDWLVELVVAVCWRWGGLVG